MNPFMTNSLTRRSFIYRGGSVLAIPFLESLAISKPVTSRIPKRMVFLGTGFGFTEDFFYPSQAGKFSDIGLPGGMAPLKDYQDDITMVGNLTNNGATNPHGGSLSYLTGANVSGTPGVRLFNSISCDQVAASYLGEDTRYKSMVICSAFGGGHDGHASPTLSRDIAGRPIHGPQTAKELYRILFSKSAESKEEMIERMRKKKSLLDLIGINGINIKHTIGKDDQEKLDEYFQGLREIEKGLEREMKWAGTPKPQAPFPESHAQVMGEDEIKVVYDMIISALQTDLTRVVSYRMPVNTFLQGMGLNMHAHSLSHYFSSKERYEASKQRDLKLSELFAYFIGRLKQAKDIDGSNLFDNCIVSYGSNLRSAHGLKGVPAILTGGGARGIKRGEHIVLSKSDTPLANLWLTLLKEAGVPVQTFSHSNGILTEILKSGDVAEPAEVMPESEQTQSTAPSQVAPRNYTPWMGTSGKRFNAHYLGKSGSKTVLELEDGSVLEGAYIRVDF